MRGVFIVAVALGLAACQPADGYDSRTAIESGGTNVPGVRVVGLANDGDGNDVSKFCDAGRAVYIVDGNSMDAGSGIAVVANAPECAQ